MVNIISENWNTYKKWEEISKGKTKIIHSVIWEDNFIIMENLDNLSAWDGARKDIWGWKAKYSTTITSNIFEYLNRNQIPTHFKKKLSDTEILAEKCDMIPVEAVFSFVSTGSHNKRNVFQKGKKEALRDGEVLEKPEITLFYKNDVICSWGEKISDPLIKIWENGFPEKWKRWWMKLLDPRTGEELDYTTIRKPWTKRAITSSEIMRDIERIDRYSKDLQEQTLRVWEKIKNFYEKVWLDTFDGKIEFWEDKNGKLILADVIDGDSCRIREIILVEAEDGNRYFLPDISKKMRKKFSKALEWNIGVTNSRSLEKSILPKGLKIKKFLIARWLDKQGFREGEAVSLTMKKYKELSERSSKALNIFKDTLSKVSIAVINALKK